LEKTDYTEQKIFLLPELQRKVAQWKFFDQKIAFTNGVFDLLHRGHIFSLSQAAKEADHLVVGLNSDVSVKRLKGANRPVNDQYSRALIVASLLIVDAVILFEEDTPLKLIKSIMPDVLVKGGDYRVDEIAGSKEVIEAGGRVVINRIMEGFSTTSIISKTGQ
jgi:D-beta-D-heptose 7-phosphate kinase/D-beta-D-heptose 1-phosphate adenosyltransferase